MDMLSPELAGGTRFQSYYPSPINVNPEKKRYPISNAADYRIVIVRDTRRTPHALPRLGLLAAPETTAGYGVLEQ